MSLKSLQPQEVWNNFEKICAVPHPSHHLEQITAMMVEFGNNLGLETIVDKAGNILIKKPATPGKENVKKVILQSHLDMVPQKNSNVNHNFTTDPITTCIDGDWLKACDTTLGADNGIGMAAAMAVLESKTIQHGPIEALFTSDEETGMFGAFALTPEFLEADILLNLDSEEEGELFVGCAGGLNSAATWKYSPVPVTEGDVAVKVHLSGLKGGHSGLDIALGRANANKLMFRFLKEAIVSFEARLASVNGGDLRNAIPREAVAIITVPADGVEDIVKLAKEYQDLFNDEYGAIENKISFEASQTELPSELMPEPIQDDFVNAVTACFNGVMRFVPDMPEVVETSCNLGIVKTEDNAILVQCLLRSSKDSMKDELASTIESTFTLAGAKVEFSGGYSGWNPNLDSVILKKMREVYLAKFGKEAEIKVIHAGLECGIIGAVQPSLDMISFGPTMKFPHSPDEKVNIPSVAKFWDFLVGTLEAL